MLRTSTTFVWSLTMVCFILSSQTTAYWETKIGKPCTKYVTLSLLLPEPTINDLYSTVHSLQDQPNAVTCRANFTGMLECKGTDVTSGTWQPITIGEREILCPPDRARCSEVDGKHICIAERPPNRKDWADWRCDEVPDG